ncbi:oryzin [Sporothrix brasiliensis 5110]|uniref:Oryzin n=1 Tax=Sporothrix brasiliensis 5110 TaxID=1398154 RepID=A0A0C2IW77_9PEZI|nr:oryzin [Sporothrix brasiliensis 5110]KIH91050.1 oryzin [Sporothrix brasiliensis 5110]
MAPLPTLSTVVAWLAASSMYISSANASDDADASHFDIQSRDSALDTPSYKVLNPQVDQPVAGSYIAVYKTSVSDTAVKAHQAEVATSLARRNLQRRQLVLKSRAESEADRADGSPIRLPDFAHEEARFAAIQIPGFRAITLDSADDATMKEIYDAPEIQYLEQNCVVRATESATEINAQPGLSRISHAQVDPGSGYVYDNSAGYGTTVYVSDTGIQLNHTDFQGRAIWGTNVLNDVIGDDHGHGTHAAGIIGGRTFGVAKNCELVAVKTLDSTGHATMNDVVKGFNWIVANVTGRGIAGRAVVTVPITGGRLQAANDAVTAVVNAGIVVVSAAGNNGDNSTATISPASAVDSITVSAINQTTDERVEWANYGPEVTIFAAGIDVLSTFIGPTTTELGIMSGTSVSVSHVAGLAAYLIKYEEIYSPRALKKRIIELGSLTGARVWNNGPNTTFWIANNGNL